MEADITVRRALIASSLCICLLSACRQNAVVQSVTRADDSTLHLYNGVLFQNEKPYTGKVYSLKENNRDTSSIMYFADGKEDGEWKRWYDNGQLMENRFYRKGTKIGKLAQWWPDGKPKILYFFESGEYEGECKEWYADGKQAKIMHYIDGHESGSQKWWWEDGRIRANYVVINGERYGLSGLKQCINPLKKQS